MKMLLLFGVITVCWVASRAEDVAYIQIFDFIEQNKTGPNDPAIVLTEVVPDLFTTPEKYTYDLYPLDYMGNLKTPVNASAYELSFQRLKEGSVTYQHPLEEPLVLKPNENAAIFVDEVGADNLLKGSVCHTGPTPVPGLDKAIAMICPTAAGGKEFNLSLFEVVGSNRGCLGCKTGIDLGATVVQDSVHFLIDDTNYYWNISIFYNKREMCNGTDWRFGDSGIYTIVLKETEAAAKEGETEIDYSCYMFTTTKPSNYWMPIWLTLVVLVVIILFIVILVIIDRRYPRLKEETMKRLGYWNPEDEIPLQKTEPDEKEKERKAARLQSLDTFRGLAVTIMIFVNFGGGNYFFLDHAAWNGLSLADFVFPWFMFMVGCSIVLSVQSQLKKNVAKTKILKKVGVRFLKLFLIGVFLNTGVPGGVDLTQLRIPGVLQRIGFTYLVCSVLEILFIPRLTAAENFGWLSNLLIHTWPQYIVISLFTALWCVITFILPIPGCPTGYVGPGGIADGGLLENCTGGAAGYIDRLVWGSHMYQHPTCKPMYHTTLAHDPEGILGSLTAVLTVYSGVVAGHIVVMLKSSRGSTVGALSVLSVVSLAIGLILSKGTLTGGWVPINKNLWSVSFVAITSASAYFVLAIMYLMIDFFHIWCGAPFNSAGKNPLFLYVGSYIVYSYFPFNWATSQSHGALMLQSVVGTACWLLVGFYLDCKKKYYKI
ncbi:heparan-alpha-glucosaminide N-acetyltransferase-like isoform X3 [Bolinopsis microptera]|uniref:heparan-alpha-glucosaminide N-acetyltransferase-like isoform X3 n=1 Tax=Bolinopsis microptera TaxID=2820187 RepID=UPI0030794AD9